MKARNILAEISWSKKHSFRRVKKQKQTSVQKSHTGAGHKVLVTYSSDHSYFILSKCHFVSQIPDQEKIIGLAMPVQAKLTQ